MYQHYFRAQKSAMHGRMKHLQAGNYAQVFPSKVSLTVIPPEGIQILTPGLDQTLASHGSDA